MGLLDLVNDPTPSVAYLFPEVVGAGAASRSQFSGRAVDGVAKTLSNVFVFQFWPNQVQDRYEVNYSTKQIPGGSHPLYQWVGGNGRTISFDATFVTEVEETISAGLQTATFNARIAQQGRAGAGVANAVIPSLLPSSRYTVDVAAAIAGLQQYLYGNYNDTAEKKGIAEPPKKLVLVLPNTQLGRGQGNDGVLCILLRADVTIESWFPSGRIRSATVGLEFAEIVQESDGEGSNIKFIGADAFESAADRYRISGVTASNFNSESL